MIIFDNALTQITSALGGVSNVSSATKNLANGTVDLVFSDTGAHEISLSFYDSGNGTNQTPITGSVNTIISLKASDVSLLFAKTDLMSKTSALTFSSSGTSRTWVEALIQKGVLKELTESAITSDKRKKYLYASANTRVKFYKYCIHEMLNHISGVADLFGQESIQLKREIDLFAGYQVLTKEEIFQFLEERTN